MTAAKKTTWTPIIEMATTKDPKKFWQLQRIAGLMPAATAAGILNAVGAEQLRCTCPGYIFRTRKAIADGVFNAEALCKHLKHLRANPQMLLDSYEPQGELAAVGQGPATVGQAPVKIRVVDDFKLLVTQAAMDCLTLERATMVELTRTAGWNLFVDKLRALGGKAPTTAPTVSAGRLRRIVIED